MIEIPLGPDEQDPAVPQDPNPKVPRPVLAPAPETQPQNAFDRVMQGKQKLGSPPGVAPDDPFAPFRAVEDQRRQQTEQLALENFDLASKDDAKLAAEAQRLARELNLDPDTATRNIDVIRRLATTKALKDRAFFAESPVLAKAMENIEFAQSAHNDLENLSFIDRLSQGFTAGRFEDEQGMLGMKWLNNEMQDADFKRLAAVQREIARLYPARGVFGSAGHMLGQQFQSLPRAVESGLILGNAAALVATAAGPGAPVTVPAAFGTGFTTGMAGSMLATSIKVEAGTQFIQMRQAGYSEQTSRWAALGVGAFTGALDTYSGGVLTKGLRSEIQKRLGGEIAQAFVRPTVRKAGVDFAVRTLENILTETSTETMQSVAEMAGEEIARWIDKVSEKDGKPLTSAISRGEFLKQLGETAASVAQGMVLLGAFDPGVQLRTDLARVVEARKSFDKLNRLLDGSAESELRKADPVAAEKLFGQMTRGKIDNLYVDKEAFAAVLKQVDSEDTELRKSAADRLNEVAPGIFDAAAANPGEDVVIPSEVYMAHIAGDSKLDKALRPHLRIEAGALSFAEAEKIDVKQRVAEFKKAAEEQVKFETAATEFETNLLAQAQEEVKRVGADLTSPQVKAAVNLARRMYETLARENGKTVAELKPLTFGPRVTDQTVAQTDDAKITRGVFDIANNRITLNSETNVTTLNHEIMHSVWNMALAVPERSESLQSGIDEMFEWMGLTEAEWNGLTEQQREPHHEKVARAWEIYLGTGKAPTIELQPIFDRIAKWFRDVYRDIVGRINAEYKAQFGTDLPALTPEVRLFFDHLLAAEDAMQEAEAIRGRAAMFEDRANFTGTDEEWAEIQALETARREGGIHKLSAEMQKNIKWLEPRRKQLRTEVDREARALRQKVGADVHESLKDSPVYALRTWLKTGKNKDEIVHRLRVEDIQAVFGPEAHDILDALGPHIVQEGGWPLDYLAEHFGFGDDTEGMVRQLIDAPTLADAVEQQTNETMLQQHGTMRDAESQAAAVEDALNTEASSKLLAAIMRTQDKLKTPDRLTLAAAKEQARVRLQSTPVGKINARAFQQEAARAEKKARDAFNGKRESKTKTGAKGSLGALVSEVKPAKAPNPQEGVEFLRQALLYDQMAKQAAVIQQKVADRAKSLVKRFFSTDAKVLKTRNLDWVNTGRAILGGYGLGPQSKLPLEHLASLEAYDPILHSQLMEYVNAATQGDTLQDYEKLSLTDWNDFADNLDSLWDRSLRERQIQASGKLVERATAKKEIIDLLRARAGTAVQGPLSKADRRSANLNNSLAKIAKTEHILLYLDGGTAGPLTNYLWTTLRQALDKQALDLNDVLKRFNKLFSDLQEKGLMDGPAVHAAGLNHPFQNTGEILGALVHMGNQSNEDNLLNGYGWTKEAWTEFLQKLHDTGRITRAHIDALQAIGKIHDELKDRAQTVNKEAYGTYFPDLKIEPRDTPWGRIEGWYSPSPIDPDHPNNNAVSMRENAENPIQSAVRDMAMASVSPKVPAKWREGRVGGARPRLMDITRLPAHFDEQLRFIHLQIPLRDVWSLVSDQEVASLLDTAVPGFVKNVLKPMLDDTALGRMTKPSLGGAMIGKVLTFIRRNVSRRYMFGSISNWLQQYTGTFAIAAHVPPGVAWSALREFNRRGKREVSQSIMEKSAAMRARFVEHQGSQAQDLKLWLNPSIWGKIDRGLEKASYYLIQSSQGSTDMVAWLAGYNHALTANPENEAAAIEAGDRLVRVTQGSRTTMDTSSLERSTPEMQLLMQFSHYWINMSNQVRFTDDRVHAATWAYLLPTFAGAAIALGLSGGKAFEDKEEKEEFSWKRAGIWLVNTPMRGAGSMLPVIGPLGVWMFTNRQRRGSVPPIAPAMSGIVSTSNTIQDIFDNLFYVAGEDDTVRKVRNSKRGATTGQGIRDLGNTIAFWTGVPLPAVMDALGYLEDRADRVTDSNAFSGLLGLRR